MTRWMPLPADMHPDARRFVERLRTLKDRTGLSLAALAAKTGYSRSSWQRYLNGLALAPWPAAEALATLASEHLPLLRARWELAGRTWAPGRSASASASDSVAVPGTTVSVALSGTAGPRDAPVPAPDTPVLPPPPQGRRGRRPARSVAATAACAVLLTVAASASSASRPPVWPYALPDVTAPTGGPPDCAGYGCQGRDPVREGCAGHAVVLGRFDWRGRTLRLRYSPACRAVWGEVSSRQDVDGLSVSAPPDHALWAASRASHTPMIAPAAPRDAQACAFQGERQFCVDSDGASWAD